MSDLAQLGTLRNSGLDGSSVAPCSALWAKWQRLLSIAQKSRDRADVEKALAAWRRWLRVFISDAEQCAAIPTPIIVAGVH